MTHPARGSSAVPRWIVVLLVVVVFAGLLYVLRRVLTPIFFGFLIAYLLDPVIDWFETRRVPRAVGIAVMLTLVLGMLSSFLLLALPDIVADIGAFLGELPASLERLHARVEPWLAGYGVAIPASLSEVFERVELEPRQLTSIAAPAGEVLGWLVGGTASFFLAIASLLVIPVFAAYLLYDFDRITTGAASLAPVRWRPFVVDVGREVDEVLSAFIRGQLLVMVALALLYASAYALLDVRLAIVIGIVAGLLSFIPYVGGAVALGLALVMCFIDWQGWWQIIGVTLAYSVIQVLEGFVITPRIIGDKVGLSAVWVLFALLVGADVFGFLGVLLAVPAAAVLKIFVLRGLAWYRRSSFYLAASPDPQTGLGALLRDEGLPDDPEMRRAKAASAEKNPKGERERV